MSAPALLLELRARGVAVDAAHGKIRCRHKPGALPPELAERVRARRGEVLALLADPDSLRLAAARGIFDAEPDQLSCRACGTVREPRPGICPVCHPPPCARAGR